MFVLGYALNLWFSCHSWSFKAFSSDGSIIKKNLKKLKNQLLYLLALFVHTLHYDIHSHFWVLDLILLLESLSDMPRHLLSEFTPFFQPRLAMDTVGITQSPHSSLPEAEFNTPSLLSALTGGKCFSVCSRSVLEFRICFWFSAVWVFMVAFQAESTKSSQINFALEESRQMYFYSTSYFKIKLQQKKGMQNRFVCYRNKDG